MTRRVLVLLSFVLAGCAAPVAELPLRTVPSGTCDYRMVDHNRRACLERGLGFMEPGTPGSCGACTR